MGNVFVGIYNIRKRWFGVCGFALRSVCVGSRRLLDMLILNRNRALCVCALYFIPSHAEANAPYILTHIRHIQPKTCYEITRLPEHRKYCTFKAFTPAFNRHSNNEQMYTGVSYYFRPKINRTCKHPPPPVLTMSLSESAEILMVCKEILFQLNSLDKRRKCPCTHWIYSIIILYTIGASDMTLLSCFQRNQYVIAWLPTNRLLSWKDSCAVSMKLFLLSNHHIRWCSLLFVSEKID